MPRPFSLFAALLLALPLTAPALAQDAGCILCEVPPADGSQPPRERPLEIEITANLAFSRLALTGRGEASAAIDPQSGMRRVGGGMVDLGGVTVQGRGRISGASAKPGGGASKKGRDAAVKMRAWKAPSSRPSRVPPSGNAATARPLSLMIVGC